MSHHAFKTCYCHTCARWFHYLGIARHTSMHRDKKEICEVTYTNGDRYTIGKREWAKDENLIKD